MNGSKKAKFSRRVPCQLTDELILALSCGETYTFNDLFTLVFGVLKKRGAATGGEEALRLRAYEKLQIMVEKGLLQRNMKNYTANEGLKDLAEQIRESKSV